MRSHRFFRCLVVLALTLGASATFAAKPKKGPEVLIVADKFQGEARLTRPTPENPITYMMFLGKQRDLGAPIAGVKMPSQTEIETLVANTLNAQGYTQKFPGDTIPDIFIVFTYGAAYTEDDGLDTLEFDEDTGEFSGITTIPNSPAARELFALVGGAKVQRRGTKRTDTDRLFIMVAAIDGPKWFKREQEIVWRTRISIPSRGFNLPTSMSVMLRSAAPYFGTDSTVPVFLRDEDRRQTDVEIGEATVVEEP